VYTAKEPYYGFLTHIPDPINGQDRPPLCARRTKTLLFVGILPFTLIHITSSIPLSKTDPTTAISQWQLLPTILFHDIRQTSKNNPTDEIATTHGSILMESGLIVRPHRRGHDHLLSSRKGSSGTQTDHRDEQGSRKTQSRGSVCAQGFGREGVYGGGFEGEV
jgi:hypothetical protein